MSGPAITLGAALRTVARDRGWWYKVLIGGLCYLTILGYPLADGFLIESQDNTRRGFGSPLPRWSDWANKAIIGAFGAVIDFYFFGLALFAGGATLFCGALVVSVASPGVAAQIVAATMVALIGSLELAVWVSGASLDSKASYIESGDVSAALRFSLVGAGLRRSRGARGGARWRSAPLYAVALAVLIGALWLGSGWGRFLGIWLGLSVWFAARLVAIQLYSAAGQAQSEW